MRYLLAMAMALVCLYAQAGDAVPWDRIGFDQHLGARLPLDARFDDETGQATTLGEVLHGRAAVLVLNYYDCPNLCQVVLKGAFEGLARVGLRPGEDYELVALSIDPRERPALALSTRARYLARFHRDDGDAAGAGIHFLTGREPDIERVARTAGFRYAWDDALKQYAHAAGLVIVAPDGRITRYLFGAQYPTLSLRLALVEASHDVIGTLADRVWLLCYHYDPDSGRYGVAIVTALRVAGGLAAGGLALYLFVMLRRERRRHRTA